MPPRTKRGIKILNNSDNGFGSISNLNLPILFF
jgi:hypothetical protein